MNEEISRILRMLEDGKIGAEEAERLLRALKEAATAGPEPAARKDVPDILQAICKAIKGAGRRQRCIAWWRYYWALRRNAEEKRRRSAEMTVAGRINYLFEACGLADPKDLAAGVALDEKAGFDRVSRQVLRYALEDEFGVEATADEVLGLGTVAEVVAFVEGRLAPPPSGGEQPAEPAAGEEAK
jgi:acyl carrier protein